MAVSNWTGLVNLCLDQVREKNLHAAAAHRRSMAGRSPSCQFSTPPPNAKSPVIRYLPSYRLEPKNALNREICEKIIKDTMDKAFEEFVYHPLEIGDLCTQLSEEIKQNIKQLNYERYRYICLVTIGEHLWQEFSTCMHFLWDEKHDGYISYAIDDPKFFALAVFFYLYYD